MGTNKAKVKELIEEWDWVINGNAKSPDGKAVGPLRNLLDDDINDVEIQVRDRIHDKGLDNIPEIQELDKQAMKVALDYGGYYRTKPPQAKDLKRWWWHLEKIQEGKYPSELLPDHLRKIYEKWKKNT